MCCMFTTILTSTNNLTDAATKSNDTSAEDPSRFDASIPPT